MASMAAGAQNSMGAAKGEGWSLRSKVWLEIEGRPVIGSGRLMMLRAIDRHGSILHAAIETGISYRKMRGAIRDMEAAIGHPLVESRRGGESGGGATLTRFAHELLRSFEKFSSDLQNEAKERFRNFLKDFS